MLDTWPISTAFKNRFFPWYEGSCFLHPRSYPDIQVCQSVGRPPAHHIRLFCIFFCISSPCNYWKVKFLMSSGYHSFL
jgi:hypothetical protein